MAYNKIVQNFLPSSKMAARNSLTGKVKGIAVHWTAGSGGDAEALYNWYLNAPYSVNCHYAIGLKGQVIQYVPEDTESWCTNQANDCTISIEVCNSDKSNTLGTWTDATYDSLIQLVVELLKKYKLKPERGIYNKKTYQLEKGTIIRHYDVTEKNCPLRFVSKSAGGVDDESNSNYLKFLKDVENRYNSSGTKTTGINYLFHPLGDYCKNFENETAPLEAYAHTYPGHGWSRCDWNPGGGHGVYSMTDGTIVQISQFNDRYSGENRKGYYVYVIPKNINYKDDCCIRYIELGGLADELCDILTTVQISKGVATYNASRGEWTQTLQHEINKGTLLGYTNSFPTQSSVHIDFMKSQYTTASASPNDVPNISGLTLASGFTVSGNKIYRDGKIIGNNDGYVPNMYKGGASSQYTVYPIYSYCIQLQEPFYLSAKQGNSIDNLTSSFKDVGNAPGEYGKKIFSDRYMGKYPSSLEELNSDQCIGIRLLTFCAINEMGQSQFGLAYGKLFRTWIMYCPSVWNNKAPNQTTTLKDFAYLWNFSCRPAWGLSSYSTSKYCDNLDFAQNLYNNIKYCDAYGITDQDALYACFSAPAQNESNRNGINKFSPFVFIICKNKPEAGLIGNETTGAGCFLLYRTKNWTIGKLNSNI